MAAGTAVDFTGFNDTQDGISDLMTMPKTITVDDQGADDSLNQSQSRSGSGGQMFDPMRVPDRIVINGEQGGYLASKNDIPRELKEDFVPNSFMGGMSTPPRTLTVDDTTSAYYPHTKSTTKPNEKNMKDRKRDEIKHFAERNVDDESLITGLEIIEEVDPNTDDIEEEFAHEYEVVDLRKSVIRLNRRVAVIEREMERNGTFGFWSKMLFFTFTIINPLILTWLFGRKR